MALDKFQPYLFVSAGEQSNKFLTPTYADGIAEFQAQRAQSLTGLTVRIDPIQDLHGQANPYPAGGGKNQFNLDDVAGFNPNVTITKTADSFTVVNNNSYAAGVFRDANGDIRFPVTDGQYTISIGQAITENIDVYASTNGIDFSWFDSGITAGRTSKTFTISGQTYIYFSCFAPANGRTLTIKQFQFEKGSTATAYAPYSNICPISGRTGLTVTVQSGETQNEYPVTWETEAGTVYGGTLDVVSGVLTVTDAQIASYAGETLPGEWISDRDVYTAGTTPTTGAQVVYKLATPQTYRLTGAEVRTIAGYNQIYSDAGPVIDIKF